MVELILDKPCRVVYNIECYRGVAQLVAHMTGGHGAAGSSPVTPTTSEQSSLCSDLFFAKNKSSAHFLAPPLSRKSAFASAIRLQARS